MDGSYGVCELVGVLGRVADPRQPRGVRHQVATVLAVTVFAVLAGARNFREAGDRAADLPPELLALAGARWDQSSGRYVAPSEPTIRRMVHGIDADAADAVVGTWLACRADHTGSSADAEGTGPVLVGLAIDGKTIRNSAGLEPTGSDVKLFSAMLHHEAVVIAQQRVPTNTNEITRVAPLLDDRDLTGMVVTGDAAHAQRATAAYLTGSRQADYALTVKGNQPDLLTRINAALPPAAPGSADHLETDTSNGRTVHRSIWTVSAAGIDFPGAAQVFRIRRDTLDALGVRISKDIAHGITSLTREQADAARLAGLVRSHWGIENKSHWVRDVVYNEDHQHAYTGASAQVMATMRNLAIGLLRLAGITQIKRTLEHIAADRTRILPLLQAT